MKLLAIETVGLRGGVAALEDGRPAHSRPLDPGQRAAQSLAPGMREALKAVGWRPANVGLVAVAQGPGSFTGLRIGVTTAKTFAYAVGAEVLGVNTLEAVAARAPSDCRELEIALDAMRGQVFAGTLKRDEDGDWSWVEETRILDIDRWLASLRPGVPVSGPMLEKLADCLPAGVETLPQSLWAPDAASVGQVAWRHYQAGRRDDLWRLVPHYYRPSAAEEKARSAGNRS